ncbi:MAG: 5-carboxymethyl-2-hydroxymuconate Delta-isomerase [Flavobacteriaceae bacterium]
MPHFTLECSPNIINKKSPQELLDLIYQTALKTDLFIPNEIKVRLKTYEYFNNGNSQEDFIHIFGHIMQGRTAEQKKTLSSKIINCLETEFPEVPILSMNVQDFEKASYSNKSKS